VLSKSKGDTKMNARHVVTGAGPVGWTVAEQLAAEGNSVRIVTRSGSGPEHPLIERVKADASQPSQLAALFDGAAAVYHCIHASKYDATVWRAELPAAEHAVMDAAGRGGAVVVFPESLYSYGSRDGSTGGGVMYEDSPRTASTGKLGIRTELLRARETSRTPAVSVVASDFFGPQVLNAHMGERVVPNVLAGKKIRVIANADMPHSFTYVPDLARAMIAAAQDSGVWNSILHAPTGSALTQREMITVYAKAAGVPAPEVGAIPAWALKATGVFSSDARELAEMTYQFAAPFVMDSTKSEQRLGFGPTPLATAAAVTIAWWRTR